MAERSIQHELDDTRPPRVQITYDVETGGAIQQKEIPMVVGVLASLSGHPDPDKPPAKLKDRKFVEIDRDNFNKVMKSIEPRLSLRVKNQIPGGEEILPLVLNFSGIDDFAPAAVAGKVKPLADMLELRGKLTDLLAKLDGNDRLEALLAEVAKNTDKQKQLEDQIAAKRAEAAKAAAKEGA